MGTPKEAPEQDSAPVHKEEPSRSLSENPPPAPIDLSQETLQPSDRQKALKILVVTDNFLPHRGGSRVYYYQLYRNLVAAFPDQVTILTKKVPGWQEFDRSNSSESFRIIRRFKPLPTWKYAELPKIVFPLADALRLVWRDKVDLIHPGDLYPPGMIALLLKRALGIPYLAYCHGEEVTQTDLRRYQPRARDRIYREAAAVVAACEFARQNLIRIGIPEERIAKITPGVDCESFAPRPPRADLVERFRLQGKKVLLTVSRLFPRKGHDSVLWALAKLPQLQPQVRYLIAGEGPDEEHLRRLTRELGLSHAVKFVGHVPDEELGDYYNLCDVFVMPNRAEPNGDMEGFGMVFLEANAAGKPVIGGRSGGTADAVVDGVTGLLVNPDEVEELVAAVRKLVLNENYRKDLGQAGLRRAREEFSWRARAKILGQLSHKIVERARAGAR